MKRFYSLSLLAILTAAVATVQSVSAQGSTSQGSGSQGSAGTKINWMAKPFDQCVFIENKGQFDTIVHGSSNVLYSIKQADMNVYFTANSMVYRYDEYPKRDKNEKEQADNKKDPDLLPQLPPIVHFLTATWVGASSSVTIEGQEEQSDYYT
jgi:hypothetical protein